MEIFDRVEVIFIYIYLYVKKNDRKLNWTRCDCKKEKYIIYVKNYYTRRGREIFGNVRSIVANYL